jgi:hypothetical protein
MINPHQLRWLWNLRKANAEKVTERKAPEKCVFCGTDIKADDYYYLGYTEGHIYAETCDSYNCTKWLKQKSYKLRKP